MVDGKKSAGWGVGWGNWVACTLASNPGPLTNREKARAEGLGSRLLVPRPSRAKPLYTPRPTGCLGRWVIAPSKCKPRHRKTR